MSRVKICKECVERIGLLPDEIEEIPTGSFRLEVTCSCCHKSDFMKPDSFVYLCTEVGDLDAFQKLLEVRPQVMTLENLEELLAEMTKRYPPEEGMQHSLSLRSDEQSGLTFSLAINPFLICNYHIDREDLTRSKKEVLNDLLEAIETTSEQSNLKWRDYYEPVLQGYKPPPQQDRVYRAMIPGYMELSDKYANLQRGHDEGAIGTATLAWRGSQLVGKMRELVKNHCDERSISELAETILPATLGLLPEDEKPS